MERRVKKKSCRGWETGDKGERGRDKKQMGGEEARVVRKDG